MVALTLTTQAIRGALGNVELTARRQQPPGSRAMVRGVGATGYAGMQADRHAGRHVGSSVRYLVGSVWVRLGVP